MTTSHHRITIDLDDQTLERLTAIAARSGHSVEEWLLQYIKELVHAQYIIR